jgi:hypothetical protein
VSAHAIPGPWEVSADGIWGVSPWNARVRIASVTSFSPMNGIDSAAHTHRISAVPEMFEAIEAIEFALSQGMPAALVLDENSPIRDCLRAAYAKAKGATP